MKKIIAILAAAMSILAVASCGSKEHKYTETELLLVDKNWAPDVNANLQSSNEAFESSTGISSDIQLGGDVKTIGDFLSGKYFFGKDTEDPSILVYSITTGKGLLSAVTGAGRWEMSADGKTLFLTPYDYEAGAYAETPTRYEIVELTADKLVWKEEGSSLTKTFVAE